MDINLTVSVDVSPQVSTIVIQPPSVINVAVAPAPLMGAVIDATSVIQAAVINQGPKGDAGDSKALIETSGPTTLPIGAVSAQSVLIRDNTNHIVGSPLEAFVRSQSTGIIKGGILSINPDDDTKFDMTEVWGQIVDNWTDLSN